MGGYVDGSQRWVPWGQPFKMFCEFATKCVHGGKKAREVAYGSFHPLIHSEFELQGIINTT